MTTMLEKAARAIFETDGLIPMEAARTLARAALIAIRESTRTVEDAIERRARSDEGGYLQNSEQVWETAIDAILQQDTA